MKSYLLYLRDVYLLIGEKVMRKYLSALSKRCSGGGKNPGALGDNQILRSSSERCSDRASAE